MAGGVMGQVQGLIPGMRREEEVPDPVPQEEYQEYQVSNPQSTLIKIREISKYFPYGLLFNEWDRNI